MNILEFFLYLIATAFTPGPNTIMSMNFGSRLGLRKALPFIFGIFSGMLFMALCAAFFGRALFAWLPGMQNIMKWFGIAYLLWLAWHTFRSGPLKTGATERAATFRRGLALQFVNVKGLIYAITSMTTFVLPHVRNPFALVLLALLLAVVALFSNLTWSGFGSLFRSLFQVHHRIVNAIMALLLIYCAWSLYR